MRRALLLLACLLLLSGCTPSPLFEHAPGKLYCDRELAGIWTQVEEAPEPHGSLRIDSDCSAQLDGLKFAGKTRITSAEAHGQRYLALNAVQLSELMEGKTPQPETSEDRELASQVWLIKYRLQDDELRLLFTSASIAPELENGRLPARRIKDYHVIQGSPRQVRALLTRRPDLYDSFDDLQSENMLRLKRMKDDSGL